MVKYCAVEGCSSGRAAYEHKRVAQELRKKTLFQVLKCHTRRQLWVNALKQELKDNDRICELHFLDGHIIKGKSYVINGKSVFIENQRWHLTDNAIPILKDKNDDKQLMDCSQDQQECEQLFLTEREDLQLTGEQLEQPSELPVTQMESLSQHECEKQLIQEPHFFLTEPDDLQSTGEQLKQPSELTVTQMGCDEISIVKRPEVILTDHLMSLEQLYEYMSTVETFTICCGISLNEIRYSSQCRGIITKNEEYRRQRLYPRCQACRTLR